MRGLGALLSLVLVLSLCNQPHARAAKRGAKAKPAASKSPDTAGLKRDHPNDPVKWFDQVNVHFKAGEKNKAADLLHDASRQFPHQPDMRFNHAFVRYELGEYDVAVHVLEKLVKPRRRRRAPATDSPPAAGRPAEDGNPAVGAEVEAGGVPVESKWVDLLIKGYVKVGRVADAVRLTDEQLLRIDRVNQPFVHARVALTVFPWRYGAAVWANIASHRAELVRASELTLQLSPKEVEEASLRMTPHNSLIFLGNELGAEIVARYVSQTYSVQPINGTYPRLRVCPSCQYRARLRLGYLLWEVRESDVLYSLVAGLLQEHARQQDPPQVRVYSLTRRPPPESLTFPAKSFITFVSFSGVGGRDAAQVIRREKTEVLFDLTTYGDLTGAHILQHLPAPVQVGFLGYPGPKVAPFINSSLWDRHSQPPDFAVPGVWHRERLVYSSMSSMPSSHVSLFGRAPACGDAGAERKVLGVAEDVPLLCNLLQTWKIQEEIFGVWMEVLRERLPAAVLVLWEQSGDTRINLGDEARARGVDPETRIRFVRRTDDTASYHRRLCACDLFLDTPFYNAGSTTPTVLWAGVPVLTLAGNRTASRLAAGFLLGAAASRQLAHLTVARTIEEYAELMVLLAPRHSPGWALARKALRFHRDNAHKAASLFSTTGYAREMERAGILLRRLGAAAPDAASRYHLVLGPLQD